MSNHFDRAAILYNQGRYQLAEQEIRQELALAPHQAGAHAILGLCLARQQQYLAALTEAKSAIHLAPDVSYFHHALADIYRWQGQLASAYISISEAIRIDPQEPDYLVAKAAILFERGEQYERQSGNLPLEPIFGEKCDRHYWNYVLSLTTTARQLNPNPVEYINLQTIILAKTGNLQGAIDSSAEAMTLAPDNAIAQANYGYALIQQNKYYQAISYFRNSLRIAPDLEFARLGLLESLKSQYFIYRWMSITRKSGRISCLLAIVSIFVRSSLHPYLPTNFIPAQFLIPFVCLSIFFSVTAAISFDCLLQFNSLGKLIVKQPEAIKGSICWFGTLLLVCLTICANTISNVELRSQILFVLGTISLLIMPILIIPSIERSKSRKIMVSYTGLLAGLGSIGLLLHQLGTESVILVGTSCLVIYLLGIIFAPILSIRLSHNINC